MEIPAQKLIPRIKFQDPFHALIHSFEVFLQKMSSEYLKIDIVRRIEIDEEKFLELPEDVRYLTGQALARIYLLLREINKKPSKILVTLDEELNEPQLVLIFDRKLAPKEEINLLRLISRILLLLAEKNERFLDIHIIIDYSQ